MDAEKLVKKLKLKPGLRAAVLHAPEGYLDSFTVLPGLTLETVLDGQVDWLQVFVKNKAELDVLAAQVAAALKPVSILWIAFPKGTSGMQTDLTRDAGWDALQGVDLKWTNLVSIDENWSAFSLRPYKPGEERKSWR